MLLKDPPEEEGEPSSVSAHWIQLQDGCPKAGPIAICETWARDSNKYIHTECYDEYEEETYVGRITMEISA